MGYPDNAVMLSGYGAIVTGRLAQLVEHLVYTERVGGSIPSPPTILELVSFSRENWLAGPEIAGNGRVAAAYEMTRAITGS